MGKTLKKKTEFNHAKSKEKRLKFYLDVKLICKSHDEEARGMFGKYYNGNTKKFRKLTHDQHRNTQQKHS